MRKTSPRRRRSAVVLAGALSAAVVLTLGLRWLRGGPPEVDRAVVVIDTVERGEMVRQVQGPGTLVSIDVRWITSDNAGRVERVLVEAGAVVDADAILIELSNPDVRRRALEVDRELAQSRAKLAELEAGLDNRLLAQESLLATLVGDLAEARRQAVATRGLYGEGAVSEIERDNAADRVVTLEARLEFERRRLAALGRSGRAQVVAQRADISRLAELLEFARREVERLAIRAGAAGVVKELRVEPGQSVAAGALLGKVVAPGRLKAALRIPETHAKDVAVGMPATIDTRATKIPGRVVRIDPAAAGGTVGVDVALERPLPPGARIDLNVDGTIEIERLTEVLFVGRPAFGDPESKVSLYRLEGSGREAVLVAVDIGKSSIKTVVVEAGLAEGDKVILSDLSDLDQAPRIRID